MTAALFTPEWLTARPRVAPVTAASSLVEEAVFSAEWLGLEDLAPDERSHVRLIAGEHAFEVRGAFDSFSGPEIAVLEVDGEPALELPPRSVHWTDLRARREAEARRLADREWLLSRCPPQWLESPATRRWLEAVYTRGFGHGLELVEEFAREIGTTLTSVEWAHTVLALAQVAGELEAPRGGGSATLPVLRMLAGAASPDAGGARDAAVAVLDHVLLVGWVTTDMKPVAEAAYHLRPMYRGSIDSFRFEPQVDEERWASFPDWLTRIRVRFPWGITNVRRRTVEKGR